MSVLCVFNSRNELPENWRINKLDEVAVFTPGASVDDVEAEDLVHFVPMASVAENFSGIDVSTLRPLDEVRKGYTTFKAGDVLFAKITPCMENGKGGLVPTLTNKVAYGSTEFHVLRPTAAVCGKWIAYFLSQPAFRRLARVNMTGTAGQMRVPAKWLKAVHLPVPPREQQSRIVEKLEELLSDLDAGVAELKTAQKKLAQYRQSLLKAAVEGQLTAEWRAQHTPAETGAQLLDRILTERRARWEAKQLAKFKEQGRPPPKDWQKKYPEPVHPDTGDLPDLPDGWVWASVDCLVANIESGKSFKCDERPPGSGETGVIKVSAVSWGEYDEIESKTCTDAKRVNPLLFIRTGDFLFSRANTVELVGACVIVEKVSLNIMLSDKILRIELVQEWFKKWLLILLRSQIGRRQIELLATGNQESMKNIGQERIRRIAIPIGPKDEIDHGVILVERELVSASQQMAANKFALKQAAAQRQNILRAAFAGELVAQDPNDEPASVLLDRIRAERASAPIPLRRRRKVVVEVHDDLPMVAEQRADYDPTEEGA